MQALALSLADGSLGCGRDGETEWSPAAGRWWHPQLGEVFQNVSDGSCLSMKVGTISCPLHLCSELHRGRTQTPCRSPPAPAPISAAACVVSRDWCIKAGRGEGAPAAQVNRAPDGEEKHKAEVLDADILGMADAPEAGAEVIRWVGVSSGEGVGWMWWRGRPLSSEVR
jgi:hypothetical protein